MYIHLKFLAISFIVLLSACGGFASPAGVDEAPAVGGEPQAAPVEATETEQPEPATEAAPPAAEKIEDLSEADVISPEADVVEEEAAIIEEEQPENIVEEAEIEPVENQVDTSAETAAADGTAAVDNETGLEEAAPVETGLEETVETGEVALAEEAPGPEEQPVKKTGPSPEQQALLTSLNVLGQPPELFNEVWLNSEPLKLADLHGKVVIVEFWTFG